jgi:hypothetical protein
MVPLLVALLLVAGQFGQTNTGELRLTVTDSTGLPLPGPIDVVSQANDFHQRLETDSSGALIVRRLPFGSYRIGVSRPGFSDVAEIVEVRSALPTEHHVRMNLSSVETEVTVSADATLIDPHQATSAHRIGSDTLQQRTTTLPGRVLPDIVNTQTRMATRSKRYFAPARLGVPDAIRHRRFANDRQSLSGVRARTGSR